MAKDDVTNLELCDSFLEACSGRGFSQCTLRAYKSDLQGLLDFAGDRPILGLSRQDIRSWMTELYASGLIAKSVGRKLSTVRSLYAWAHRDGLTEESPVKEIKGPKLPKKLPRILTEAEAALAMEVTDPRNRAILEILYGLGCRCAELCSLTWPDINWTQDQVLLHGKGSRDRIVPLGSYARAALLAYGGDPAPAAGPVFTLSARAVYDIVEKRLAAVTGLRGLGPHCFRHSMLSIMMNRGAPIRALQELAGHVSLDSTAHYIQTTKLRETYLKAFPRAT